MIPVADIPNLHVFQTVFYSSFFFFFPIVVLYGWVCAVPRAVPVLLQLLLRQEDKYRTQ